MIAPHQKLATRKPDHFQGAILSITQRQRLGAANVPVTHKRHASQHDHGADDGDTETPFPDEHLRASSYQSADLAEPDEYQDQV
jgi:hypothetical protein